MCFRTEARHGGTGPGRSPSIRRSISANKALGTETTFLPVTITDAPEQSTEVPQSIPGPAPVIVERSAPGIEVELIGGRRVRFERDVDPETVRRLVSLLEGEAR